MVQVSYIPGHEIRIVSYALWDGGNCSSIVHKEVEFKGFPELA
jgi:hypothetical protein